MITIKKLSGLKERTRIRKSAYLFKEFSRSLLRGEEIDLGYVRALINLPELLQSISSDAQETLRNSEGRILSSDERTQIVLLDDLYYLLLAEIGASVADWDILDDETGTLDASSRLTFPLSVYLDRLRSPFNVGSVFRTADSFGVDRIYIGEGTTPPEHPRAIRTARGCDSTIDWENITPSRMTEKNSNPIFALELGGTPIGDFPFPARGTVIIGSEELGVSPEMLSLADRSLGRVSIPLAGTKGSLNVSVAFGILMQHWFSALQ